MECYLDNSATTRAFDDVAQLVADTMTKEYGNPSSMHHYGKIAEDTVKKARKQIAATLACNEKEILFTSGGTESDNMALIGTARAREKEIGRHLITSSIEHPAILETMRYLEKQGFEVTYLPVDKNGQVLTKDLEKAIRPDTIAVSIMLVNNEIGALEPIEECGRIIKKLNPKTYFHVDAVQGYGKFRINPSKMGIDLMSVSGHKIHGPKGTGFLYIKNGVRIVPINYGGGQQKGMRSGTENVPGIAGLGRAAEEIYETLESHVLVMRELKDYFIRSVTDKITDVTINGKTDIDSAPHIISLSFRGVRAEVLLHALEDRGVYVSAGSACSTNRPHVSDTLKAIGLDSELLDSTLRFSMSVFTTKDEVDQAVMALESLVPMLRRYSRQ